MSITTKRGDGGQTDLLFGRRVPKTHPRMAACGAIDELSAALGLVRAEIHGSDRDGRLAEIQRDLIAVMGELATDAEDIGKYREMGFARLGGEAAAQIEAEIAALEASLPKPEGWALPGDSGSRAAAQLDFARAVCRRAEREVAAIDDTPSAILPYLNRLSDLLWLMARDEGALT